MRTTSEGRSEAVTQKLDNVEAVLQQSLSNGAYEQLRPAFEELAEAVREISKTCAEVQKMMDHFATLLNQHMAQNAMQQAQLDDVTFTP